MEVSGTMKEPESDSSPLAARAERILPRRVGQFRANRDLFETARVVLHFRCEYQKNAIGGARRESAKTAAALAQILRRRIKLAPEGCGARAPIAKRRFREAIRLEREGRFRGAASHAIGFNS